MVLWVSLQGSALQGGMTCHACQASSIYDCATCSSGSIMISKRAVEACHSLNFSWVMYRRSCAMLEGGQAQNTACSDDTLTGCKLSRIDWLDGHRQLV